MYTLTVTPLSNGTFDHRVTDATGVEVGRRNSKRRYTSATVARRSLQWHLANPHYRAEAEALVAAGRDYPAFALSFNSKPSPTPRQPYLTFLGFAQ